MAHHQDRSVPRVTEKHRRNRNIRVPKVRCIGSDGEQLGILSTWEAINLAEGEGLDLVEVSPSSTPPVCRIMDYGKFKYDESRKKKNRPKALPVKEIKFRPKTDDHDVDTKTRQIRKFLKAGHKVRMVVSFRGREIIHSNIGQEILQKVVRSLIDTATVEQIPNLEGRNMIMVIAPKGVARRDCKDTD